MCTVKAADGAEELAGGGVDSVDVVTAGDVDAMGGRVDEEVVPPAGVGELPVVEDFIGALGAKCGGSEGAKESGYNKSWSEAAEGGKCAHGWTFRAGQHCILVSERIVSRGH